MSKPSVILFGAKPGGAVALEILLSRGWNIRAVIPSGQDIHGFMNGETMVTVARNNDIPIFNQGDLPNQQVDFVISYLFRNLVKQPALKMAARAALNFHAGPLPEYGGWAFYNLAILERETEYGCTCHYMDEGFDTGPLLRVSRFPIDPSRETAWSLERKAQEEMIRLFLDFCLLAESGANLPREEQDRSRMRYLDRTSFKKLKEIPINADDETAQRYARAFFYPPYECAYINLGSTRIEVMPEIVKEALASRLHSDDYDYLRSDALDIQSTE